MQLKLVNSLEGWESYLYLYTAPCFPFRSLSLCLTHLGAMNA